MKLFSSVSQLCLILGDPMNYSMPGFPVLHQLPEFAQSCVHGVSDAVQPPHPLLLPGNSGPSNSELKIIFAKPQSFSNTSLEIPERVVSEWSVFKRWKNNFKKVDSCFLWHNTSVSIKYHFFENHLVLLNYLEENQCYANPRH